MLSGVEIIGGLGLFVSILGSVVAIVRALDGAESRLGEKVNNVDRSVMALRQRVAIIEHDLNISPSRT